LHFSFQKCQLWLYFGMFAILAFFMAVRFIYISPFFVYFSSFWFVVPRKIWQPWSGSDRGLEVFFECRNYFAYYTLNNFSKPSLKKETFLKTFFLYKVRACATLPSHYCQMKTDKIYPGDSPKLHYNDVSLKTKRLENKLHEQLRAGWPDEFVKKSPKMHPKQILSN
jgi:hypothetical protein